MKNKSDAETVTKLDNLTRHASESLARAVNRRTFLWRVGGGVFLVSWAAARF